MSDGSGNDERGNDSNMEFKNRVEDEIPAPSSKKRTEDGHGNSCLSSADANNIELEIAVFETENDEDPNSNFCEADKSFGDFKWFNAKKGVDYAKRENKV